MLIITSWVLNYVYSWILLLLRISPLASVPCCWFTTQPFDKSSQRLRPWLSQHKIPLLKGHKRQAKAQIMQPLTSNGDISIYTILPRLLQRSKECRGHYSTLYHATSQWIMRSDTHLFFWHNVQKSVHLKFKIMSITCRFHVSDMVLTLLISY